MITSRHVTGEWVHVVDDGMVDTDPLPDEARPTGHVRFDPVWPSVATSEGSAYTLTPITALVAEGQLRDVQGREGVWLPARVGSTPVQWRATTEVHYQGEKLPYPPVEFRLDTDVRLTARYGDTTVWPAPVVSEVTEHRRAAEAAAGRAERAAEDLDEAVEDARGHRDDAERHAGTAGTKAGEASDSAAAALSHMEQAGIERWAAVDERWAAVEARNQAIGAKDDTIVVRGEVESLRAAAGTSADEAAEHAGRAEAAANEFDLTASSSTLAPGAAATVTVSGDGPAYSLEFGVPQGPKGDKGDEGEISQAQLAAAIADAIEQITGNAPETLDTIEEIAAALLDNPDVITELLEAVGKRALIDGAPAQYDTLGKLVTALQSHELGGSTDASLLTGALTNQVNVGEALFAPPGDAMEDMSVLQFVRAMFSEFGNYSRTNHKHPVTDFTMTGTPSASTFARGDGTWATPPNTTYSVPTQAEAEAGTATTGRAFSAQRVRQAADAAITAREWYGTQAQYDALPTKDANRTYNILEG